MADGFGIRNPNRYANINRPFATQFLGLADQTGTGAPVSQGLMPLRQAVLQQQMRPQRTAAQQMMALPTRMKQTPAVKPPSLGDRISGMMPKAGTPEAAGLGAAGAKMLQLSGYSDRPIAMSQILGEAAQAYTTARKETAAEQAATLKAQQELERQRRKDALEERLTEAKLYEIYNKSPDETTLLKNLRAAGIDPSSPEGQGIILDYLRKGGGTDVTVTMGDGKVEPVPAVKTMLQKDIVSLDATLDNLSLIRTTMKPEYLTGQTKVGMAWNKLVDTWGTLPPEKKQELADYSQGIQSQAKLLNDYVKAMTGAQMSVAEVPRFAKTIPTAGDWEAGIPADSPTTFFAKLDQFEYMTSLARARAAYALENGLEVVRREPSEAYPEGEFVGIIGADGKTLTFGKFEQMMKDEANNIAKQIIEQNPEMDETAARKQAARQVAQKHGIYFPTSPEEQSQ